MFETEVFKTINSRKSSLRVIPRSPLLDVKSKTLSTTPKIPLQIIKRHKHKPSSSPNPTDLVEQTKPPANNLPRSFTTSMRFRLNKQPKTQATSRMIPPEQVIGYTLARLFSQAISRVAKENSEGNYLLVLPSVGQYQSILDSYPQIKKRSIFRGKESCYPYLNQLFLRNFIARNIRMLKRYEFSKHYCLHLFHCLCKHISMQQFTQASIENSFYGIRSFKGQCDIDVSGFKEPSSSPQPLKMEKFRLYETLYQKYNDIIQKEERNFGVEPQAEQRLVRVFDRKKTKLKTVLQTRSILQELKNQELYSENWHRIVNRDKEEQEGQEEEEDIPKHDSPITGNNYGRGSDAVMGSIFVLKKETENMIKFLEDRLTLT